MAYIIIEGVVGTGKTTQAEKILDYMKSRFPDKRVVLTREPGGTEISEAIRKLVQGTRFKEEMDPVCEAYLYAAARAQLMRKLIGPHLDNKDILISDRSFISSLAYQGYARGVGIDKVSEINKIALDRYGPDLVIFLKLDPAIGLKRAFDKEGDKFELENADFFRKIEEGYMKVSKMPIFSKKWKNIDASGDETKVFERIIVEIKKILPLI